MFGALGIGSEWRVGVDTVGLLVGTEGGCDGCAVHSAVVIADHAQDAESGVCVGDAGHAVLGVWGETLLSPLKAAAALGRLGVLRGQDLEGIDVVGEGGGVDVLREVGGRRGRVEQGDGAEGKVDYGDVVGLLGHGFGGKLLDDVLG